MYYERNPDLLKKFEAIPTPGRLWLSENSRVLAYEKIRGHPCVVELLEHGLNETDAVETIRSRLEMMIASKENWLINKAYFQATHQPFDPLPEQTRMAILCQLDYDYRAAGISDGFWTTAELVRKFEASARELAKPDIPLGIS